MKIKKLSFRSAFTTILVIAVCIGMLSQSASALASSSNIAIIGGPVVQNGGTFPTSGGDFNSMSFTTMNRADVNAANLALYDTVVLNVASPYYSGGLGCDIDNLNATQKADIVAFVAAGNKLIIYDSECPTQDYSWLPYPFTTSNPGAYGGTGVLTIVEENTLSSANPISPYYIDNATLGTSTDAVGDMNVMTTFDSHWCLDMSGTNYLQQTGPVHTYAKYPEGTDTGLIIYNGLDVDYMSSSYPSGGAGAILQEIWLQELQQPFNPSNLPCGFTVVGLSLTPNVATNLVGTSHTVTATVADQLGVGQPGVNVSFEITAGPNVGLTGSDITDAAGHATFTYIGTGGVGTDTIIASIECQTCPGNIITVTAAKTWEERDGEIPEFPTIAVPVLAIVGLALFFNRRK
ncbi:MAG: hypothetical protein PWQ52_189 [Methanolobus sp.]|jgi:hypothetical protein|nr:hypothetical protein [Methanolobus sp.]MDK2834409.1 hypothetical protein [Methanolobus sp.]